MPRYTIAEIAQKLDVDKEAARGLVKFLIAISLAESAGVRKSESGGRGENVYFLVDGYEKAIAAKLKRASLA